MIRLRSLYVEQYKRLNYVLRERRRKYINEYVEDEQKGVGKYF